MSFPVTCLFYLLIGGGVGTALFLDESRQGIGERVFRSVTGILFWPLYLPMLLQSNAPLQNVVESSSQEPVPEDELQAAISQVERELEAALESLDGWAEAALSHAGEQFHELRESWSSQAERIRELDRLLSQPQFRADSDNPAGRDNITGTRTQTSEASRRDNIARLHTIRKKLHQDLLGTLAWVRELVTMIHLAKFSGAPASRAEELVAQIAAVVEGLSEVTEWNQEPLSADR